MGIYWPLEEQMLAAGGFWLLGGRLEIFLSERRREGEKRKREQREREKPEERVRYRRAG